MKSYTDIEQSKKLSEILPIESADMYYPYFGDNKWGETAHFGEAIEYSGKKDIPCWSLAALFDYIKDKFNFELLYLSSTIDNKNNKIKNVYKISIDMFVDKFDIYSTEAINACYEMIIKLHEEKLL